MARKEKIITIKDRDQELTFKIREMSATQLENWLYRLASLTADAGVESIDPSSFAIQDALGLLVKKGLGVLSKIDPDKSRPLLDDLLSCCSRVVEGVEERCTPQTVDNYIQEVTTLLRLRMEVITMHVGFYFPKLEKSFGFQDETNS